MLLFLPIGFKADVILIKCLFRGERQYDKNGRNWFQIFTLGELTEGNQGGSWLGFQARQSGQVIFPPKKKVFFPENFRKSFLIFVSKKSQVVIEPAVTDGIEVSCTVGFIMIGSMMMTTMHIMITMLLTMSMNMTMVVTGAWHDNRRAIGGFSCDRDHPTRRWGTCHESTFCHKGTPPHKYHIKEITPKEMGYLFSVILR